MAMGTERSKPPLHNFNLPCGLKWGNQKFLRCAKVESNGQISAVHRSSYGSVSIGRRKEPDRHRSNFRPENEDTIGVVKEKLMFDLLTEADKMKETMFQERLNELPEKELSPALAPAPWNLRTRRAACKEPNGNNVNRNNDGSLLLRMENKSLRIPSGAAVAGASTSGEKRERVKFSVPLSRGEIEEDFVAMIGHRPPRRPKKRARLVQKNLDTLFPGLWLTEITADLYKVPEDQ